MRWGLVPSWWSKPLKELKLATFNARAETVAEKPFFRSAFKRNRCLIPVSGYYEWQDKASGEALKSCTMVITEPNRLVAEVHDRMPVLLAEKDFEPWLSGKAGIELLKAAADD